MKNIRHSRESGNPAIKAILRSRHIAFFVSLREGRCIDWIPVFTGMTAELLRHVRSYKFLKHQHIRLHHFTALRQVFDAF
jgi:hypothetical protein